MPELTFFVPGIPRPGGSKVCGFNRHTGKSFVRESGKHTHEWRGVVAFIARQAFACDPIRSAISVTVTFVMMRPKSHFNRHGIKLGAPYFPVSKPDATKLWRSTEDALTGIIWHDDSQIYKQEITKIYGSNPGARITVSW